MTTKTPEEWVDSIAKWTNAGLREAVLEMLKSALGEETARLTEVVQLRKSECLRAATARGQQPEDSDKFYLIAQELAAIEEQFSR